MKWQLVYTKQAQKDSIKIVSSGLKKKVLELLEIITEDPYRTPPRFEKLIGDLSGAYSRRINDQHRFVYSIDKEKHIVKVISMWTHYE